MKPASYGILVSVLTVALSVAEIDEGQPPTSGNVIRVEISGARNDKGQVLCALFPPDRGFPSKAENAVSRTHSAITNGSAVCEFVGVAPGRYAMSVFHDENSNGKMDTNFIGIPKEGVGASNDAKGRMGPPKFDAAAFQYSGGRLELKIKLFYI
jgi:uncharacterized protein (DUF2141 family)